MSFVKEIFRAPGIIEIKRFHSWNFGRSFRRNKNINITPESMQKANERRSREKLYRLIATNFKRDDVRLDLTYAGEEPDGETAIKRLKAFIRKLRALYKTHNQELKYIYTTEHRGHRIHHHLLINSIGLSRDEINSCWKYSLFGYRAMRFYDGAPSDARALAEYFTKETSKTMKDEDSIQRVRYVASKNLKTPDVTKVKIYTRSWKERPYVRKGYQIVDLENGFTNDGYPFQRYTMVKIGVIPIGSEKFEHRDKSHSKSKGAKVRKDIKKGTTRNRHALH